MRVCFLVLLLSILYLNLSSQELMLKDQVFSMRYFEAGEEVSEKDFESILFQNKDSNRIWNRAKKTSTVGVIIISSVATYGALRWVTNDFRRKNSFLIPGLVGIGVSVCLFRLAGADRKYAVRVYNQNTNTSFLEFGPAKEGLGFVVKF